MKKSIVTIKEDALYSLQGTYYETEHPRLLIYLHGGGLIFGERDDLPDAYLKELTRYFDVLTADYRLAPESSLDDILEDINSIYSYASTMNKPIYVMGRSAGGYLAFMMAKMNKIEGIIDFYGYHHFDHPAFNTLPKNQQHVKSLLTQDLEKLKTENIITSANPTPRYLLYLYYRNLGQWHDIMGIDIKSSKYRLSTDDLSKLPPTFIVHEIADPDVPYDFTATLKTYIPKCKVVSVESARHDFDQNVSPETIDLYQQACQYII